MDEIPQLIESAEQGDTEAARTLLTIYHESLYSNTESQTVLMGANGVIVDVRILAYLARCFRPIIKDKPKYRLINDKPKYRLINDKPKCRLIKGKPKCRCDANKALHLSTPKRGAKVRIKPNVIKVVCYEICIEQTKIWKNRANIKPLQGEQSPLEQAIEIVSKKHELKPSTVHKEYWKSPLNIYKG